MCEEHEIGRGHVQSMRELLKAAIWPACAANPSTMWGS
jgi:hypothetical protein